MKTIAKLNKAKSKAGVMCTICTYTDGTTRVFKNHNEARSNSK